MSNPIDGDLPEREQGANAAESGAVPEESVPEGVVPDGAVPEIDIPEPTIPAPEIPELEVPEPSIPDAVIPDSAFAEPVIPPPPPEEPSTRAKRRRNPLHDAPSAPGVPRVSGAAASAPASDPSLTAPEPDPAVVPPASGATPGSYRGWTIAIYLFLLVLLVAAIVTIGMLLSSGSPTALALAAPFAQVLVT